MNEQQPYEKHLADKLQKLNPPGSANSNWPRMKALLDRDLPTGGNGGNKGRWWIYGLSALILVTGTWIGSSLISKDKKESTTPIAAASTPSSNISSGEENKDGKTAGVNNTPKNNEEVTSNNVVTSDPATTINKKDSNNPDAKTTDGNTANSSLKIIDKKNKNGLKKDAGSKPKNETSLVVKNKTTINAKDNSLVVPVNSSNKGSAKIKDEPIAKAGKGNKNGRGKKGAQQVAFVSASSGKTTGNGKIKTNSIQNSEVKATAEASEFTANASSVKQDLTSYEAANINHPDSLQSDYALQSHMVTVKTRSRFKTSNDRTKALKNRSVGTGDNKNFVVGLSLPMAFPLGDQNAVAYNHNAGPNTVSDYLPAPHMQYHFNQQSFVQAEIQILSPQYIQPALLYQKRYEQTGGASNYRQIVNSVYAKKLYYFSLPVGIHYSPFKNFYVGSGLQFSSLVSGVGLYEKRGYSSLGPSAGDTLFSQSYQKFKNDSISSQLSNNEFRVMLDANYYWHRFTVGFRYNQALSNFVSVQVNSFSPLYTDKNKSMQFYLRYNIWEDKKKKKTGSVANR